MGTHRFLYPFGHFAPFFTYLIVFPLVHFCFRSELVRSPRLRAKPAIDGMTASSSVNSFCSFAFLAASDAALAARADLLLQRMYLPELERSVVALMQRERSFL